jgi:hypothetical protein
MDKEQKQRDQRDIDFLLEFREFKGVVNTKLDRALDDIRELKDGTASKLAGLEIRMDAVEESVSVSGTFYKWLVAIGILIIGLIIFHLTGYKF